MKFTVLFILFFTLGLFGVILIKNFITSPAKQITQIINNSTPRDNFSLEDAPSESLKGNLTNLNGDIFWESRIATEAAKINSGRTLQQGEMVQTGDKATVGAIFDNAVEILMKEKTEVNFVQTLPTAFVTTIASGSATFKKTGEVPLSVRVKHLLVRQNSGQTYISIDEITGLVSLEIKGNATLAYNDSDLNSHVTDFSNNKLTFNDDSRMIEVETR